MKDAYGKTAEIEPLPRPDPHERVLAALRTAVDHTAYVGADIHEAVLKLIASVERRRPNRRAA